MMKANMGAFALRSRGLPALVVLVAACGLATVAVAKGAKDHKDTKIKREVRVTDEGYLGVYMQELTSGVRKGLDIDEDAKGVLISGVEEDSPAEKAGIKEGDVITSFNGTRVTSPDELRDAVRKADPGHDVSVEVLREGQSKTMTVTIGTRDDNDVFAMRGPGMRMDMDAPALARAFAMVGGPRLGVQAQGIESDELGSYFGVKSGDGVLVLGVDKGSVADKAGVQPGDVIQKVDKDAVRDVGDLRDAVRDFDEGDDFTISVLRKGKSEDLKATMDEQDHAWAFRAPRAPRAPRGPRWFNVTPPDRDHLRTLERRDRDDIEKQLKDLREELDNLKQQLNRKDG
jgi:predicted metalloprotease with PDZ domain